jgi:hypothetical protein
MEQYPDNFHYLRYEDLVTDLKSTLMGVCAHLNIEYSDELLNYNKKNSYYKKKRENLSTFQNLQSSMAEKWKAELSQFEIGTIESVVGDLMSQHGYTPQGPKVELSRFQKLYYSLHQKFIGEIQLQYRWRRSRVVNHLRKPG